MGHLSHIDELISDERLTDTLSDLVDIASPTGEERELAEHIAKALENYGIASQVQPLDDTQSNAWGRIEGSGGGKDLLLYAPIDTVTSNSVEEDLPWAGEELRSDMIAKAEVREGHVLGLGAHNPKGHAACIIETACVLKKLGLTLPGDLYFGFGAGGMPTHARKDMRPDSGHGVGCAALISELPKPDGAIIAKSGTSVTWEEVGFIWLEVAVPGSHTYVGSRHLLPYDNAIAGASKLILALEDWFDTWAEKHATDNVRPQGVVSHIEAGWKRMPAFTPACCKFLIDLRFGPRMTGDEAEAEFRETLEKLSGELNIEANYERIQTIEASATPESDPIIQTTIAVWEELNGKPHEPFTVMSGATDANILRQHGIPTARIGLPKSDLPNLDFQLGMNSVSVKALRNLTRFLTLSAIRFCGGTDG